MKITDEMLRDASIELDDAQMASLPAPEDCRHEFSQKFCRQMHELCDSIAPVTGKVKPR